MKNFYCVVRGYHQGIFTDEASALKEVRGYYDGKYKGFDTEYEARVYLEKYNAECVPMVYVVKHGFHPGIYLDREQVGKQVVGFSGALVRKYKLSNIDLAIKFYESDYSKPTKRTKDKPKTKEEKRANKERHAQKLRTEPLTFKRKYICFLDCEANDNKVISLGAIMIDIETMQIVDSFYQLSKYKTFIEMDNFCSQLTNITTEMILNANDFSVCFQQFSDWLTRYECYEICTWSTSDKLFIARTLAEYEQKLSFKLKFINIQSYISQCIFNKNNASLKSVKNFYCLGDEIQHHALEDAKDTFEVFQMWNKDKVVICA